MAMEVPDAWLVEAVEAPYDLDNINLAAIGDAKEVRHPPPSFHFPFTSSHLLPPPSASCTPFYVLYNSTSAPEGEACVKWTGSRDAIGAHS
eukprot:8539826-Pyramimonas_sp.AAC.1